jgi:hypothetical protein
MTPLAQWMKNSPTLLAMTGDEIREEMGRFEWIALPLEDLEAYLLRNGLKRRLEKAAVNQDVPEALRDGVQDALDLLSARFANLRMDDEVVRGRVLAVLDGLVAYEAHTKFTAADRDALLTQFRRRVHPTLPETPPDEEIELAKAEVARATAVEALEGAVTGYHNTLIAAAQVYAANGEQVPTLIELVKANPV